jgi:hypothetical protein
VVSGQAAFLYQVADYLDQYGRRTALALALFLACGLLIAWLWHVSFLDKPKFPDGVLRGAQVSGFASRKKCQLACDRVGHGRWPAATPDNGPF